MVSLHAFRWTLHSGCGYVFFTSLWGIEKRYIALKSCGMGMWDTGNRRGSWFRPISRTRNNRLTESPVNVTLVLDQTYVEWLYCLSNVPLFEYTLCSIATYIDCVVNGKYLIGSVVLHQVPFWQVQNCKRIMCKKFTIQKEVRILIKLKKNYRTRYALESICERMKPIFTKSVLKRNPPQADHAS